MQSTNYVKTCAIMLFLMSNFLSKFFLRFFKLCVIVENCFANYLGIKALIQRPNGQWQNLLSCTKNLRPLHYFQNDYDEQYGINASWTARAVLRRVFQWRKRTFFCKRSPLAACIPTEFSIRILLLFILIKFRFLFIYISLFSFL